jgi:hypothetical protein
MLPLVAILALACTVDTPTDDSADSGPPDETAPPQETAPPDDSAPPEALPAVVVNELMADNESAALNEDGAYVDWLELYNAGDVALDLGGLFLSDDWTEKDKAPLPEGTTLEAGGYLLLWADDRSEAGHLPFKLSAQGEGVGVFTAEGTSVDWITFPPLVEDHAYARIPDGEETWEQVARGTPGAANQYLEEQTTTLVPKGATWLYLDDGVYPGDDWTTAAFDDSGWASGPAPMGYGDDQTTQVGYGDDANDKHPTTWFRHSFEVPEGTAADASEATLALRVDDGAVVWLNGAELLRFRIADGEVTPDTYASDTASSDEETTYYNNDLALDLLLDGSNQLAVEVHQGNATSSDLTLDLELTTEAWTVVE